MLARALLAVLTVLALAACSGGDDEPEQAASPGPAAQLTDVDGVLDVRAAFNADSGRPRLLLLLSPT